MKEKKAEAEQTKKAVKNIQAKVEKATLGDLGVLAGLKAKMDSDSDAPATSEAEATPAVEAVPEAVPAVEATPAEETPSKNDEATPTEEPTAE